MSDSIKDLRVDIIEAESNIAALLTALVEKYKGVELGIKCSQYGMDDSPNVQVDITADVRIF